MSRGLSELYSGKGKDKRLFRNFSRSALVLPSERSKKVARGRLFGHPAKHRTQIRPTSKVLLGGFAASQVARRAGALQVKSYVCWHQTNISHFIHKISEFLITLEFMEEGVSDDRLNSSSSFTSYIGNFKACLD
jgi:hypothetical protein